MLKKLFIVNKTYRDATYILIAEEKNEINTGLLLFTWAISMAVFGLSLTISDSG